MSYSSLEGWRRRVRECNSSSSELDEGDEKEGSGEMIEQGIYNGKVVVLA